MNSHRTHLDLYLDGSSSLQQDMYLQHLFSFNAGDRKKGEKTLSCRKEEATP